MQGSILTNHWWSYSTGKELHEQVGVSHMGSISRVAQHVTLQKCFSHPSLVIHCFETSPIKLEWAVLLKTIVTDLVNV